MINRISIFQLIAIIFLSGCIGKTTPPEEIDPNEILHKEIKAQVRERKKENNRPFDSIHLHSEKLVIRYYEDIGYEGIWALGDSITPRSERLITLIEESRQYGLFPDTYHEKTLKEIQQKLLADTLGTGSRNDFPLLARRDLLLTDAFLTMARHLERGHLPVDSLAKDPSFSSKPYIEALNKTLETQDPRSALESFEPKSLGYQNLKKALPGFLRTANFQKQYTYLEYPFRDSSTFIRQLIQRLAEENYLDRARDSIDKEDLSLVLKKVQIARKLTVDGKYGPQLVKSLNEFDQEKFMKAAINMDRYRMERDTLPARYLLVNLPAFAFTIYDDDTIVLESKVIIGKPQTPTPLLNSKMNQLIVFPTWTIPASIIAGEILPFLKRDPGYLSRKGYRLYTFSGEEVDPWTVDWSKYQKGIPYKIVQGEGIGNALGIMKFNFPNEHDVYLHDTNQRSLFANENRSLSHGCVRVQNWEGLYRYVIGLDSMKAVAEGRPFTPTDTIRHWLGEKKKRVIPLKNQLPIFFRYFTAAGKNGKLETYNDLYGKDRVIRKTILESL